MHLKLADYGSAVKDVETSVYSKYVSITLQSKSYNLYIHESFLKFLKTLAI